MTDVEVEPDKLRAFGDMLGEGGVEAQDARDTMAAFFDSAAEDADAPIAYNIFNSHYLSLSSPVDDFYKSAETALTRSKEAHRDMAKQYENTDEANTDEVGSVYRDNNYLDLEADPEEETGKSAGHGNHSYVDFEYVPSAMGIGDPEGEDTAKGSMVNPQHRLDIPELKEYPEAWKWAATWGMDVVFLVLQFTGNWGKAHAKIRALQSMANVNGNIAGNVVAGNSQIADTWKGETADASQKYMPWLADNVAGCQNTLESLNEAMSGYIDSVDEIASGLAYKMGWFIWEADWARIAECPKGPFNEPELSSPTLQNMLDSYDKIKQAEYLKATGDWQFKNFSTWAGKANQYIAAAYLAMLKGLMDHYAGLLWYLSDLATCGEKLESPTGSAITDLEQAHERLGAFYIWGEDTYDGT